MGENGGTASDALGSRIGTHSAEYAAHVHTLLGCAGVRWIDIDEKSEPTGQWSDWFRNRGAEAVLLRPDRDVAGALAESGNISCAAHPALDDRVELLGAGARGEVAVIGLRHDVDEEACAVVVPQTGEAAYAEQAIGWSREHLWKHKYSAGSRSWTACLPARAISF